MRGRLRREFGIALLRLRGGPAWLCPICDFRGPFRTFVPPTGVRRYAMCPRCGALERHRLQWVVARPLLRPTMRVLHVAPEAFIGGLLRPQVSRYVTVDLATPNVACRVDMTRLPFRDASFDLVWASHVLEHVRDDAAALGEVSRVLSRGGLAILPVPVIGDVTVEYPEPNPAEANHVRSPGRDYFERYRKYFSSVRVVASDEVPAQIQPFVYEDRTRWANETLRPVEPGDRHLDKVPVCTK